MISVGIFTGYLPYTLAETIERCKEGRHELRAAGSGI